MNPCPSCQSDTFTPYRHSPPDVEVVQCKACQLIYRRDRPDTDTLHALYQSYADDTSHMRLPKTFEEVRTTGLRREEFMQEVLKRVGASRGRLVDVGCGWGAFLVNARERGFEVSGVELTQRAIEFGWTYLGLDIKSYLNGYSQVITCIHSLEHLPDLHDSLVAFHTLLLPNGLLAGIVPNISSLCSQHLGPRWAWLDPNYHYTHFTPATLHSTLARHGFTHIELFTRTGDYGQAAVDTASNALSRTPTPHEGEEIWFFARRP